MYRGWYPIAKRNKEVLPSEQTRTDLQFVFLLLTEFRLLRGILPATTTTTTTTKCLAQRLEF